jgi:hypothetical protein
MYTLRQDVETSIDVIDPQVRGDNSRFTATEGLSRRSALFTVGAALLGAVADCSTSSTNAPSSASAAPRRAAASSTAYPSGATDPGLDRQLTEIPDETAGPYPGNGSNGPDILKKSGVIRRARPFMCGTATVDTRTTPTGATGPDELRHTGLKGRSAGLAGDDAARSPTTAT